MKYLVIYTHPNPKSFNHAVLETVMDELEHAGAEYEIRDLYAESFDPLLANSDIEALQTGITSEDIALEQKMISEADMLILIFPVWWFNMPAILKGYMDRVFSEGFAFEITEKGVSGLLGGRRAAIFNTTGGTRDTYQNYGYGDAFRKCVCEGIFRFCGMEVILQHFLYAVPAVSTEEREKMLEEVRGLMRKTVIINS